MIRCGCGSLCVTPPQMDKAVVISSAEILKCDLRESEYGDIARQVGEG